MADRLRASRFSPGVLSAERGAGGRDQEETERKLKERDTAKR